MRMPRTSIAGLMGGILVAALAMNAFRSGSMIWSGAMFLVTCGVLALAVVGAVCRRGVDRSWWLGSALFGWGYLALVFLADHPRNLPTDHFIDAVMPRVNVAPFTHDFGGWAGDAYYQVGHCLFGLGFAAGGGLMAFLLFGAAATRPEEAIAEGRPDTFPPRRRWRRAPFFGLTALVVAPAAALVGLLWAPGPSAAAASLATWAVLGLAVVGAVFGPQRRRAAWLGAALFGIGYLGLIFHLRSLPNWPHVMTDRLLYSVRGWFPRIVWEAPTLNEGAAANARIYRALDRAIPLHFPEESPLEDVLKAIRDATRRPNDNGIPIYVDPVGLQEAEKTLQSTITIDLEGVPLRTSLHLALKQLGMTYGVAGGLLHITSVESEDPVSSWADFPPAHADPFLVVGHCLLALIAAGLGGLLAPLVCRGRVGGSRLGSAPDGGPASPAGPG